MQSSRLSSLLIRHVQRHRPETTVFQFAAPSTANERTAVEAGNQRSVAPLRAATTDPILTPAAAWEALVPDSPEIPEPIPGTAAATTYATEPPAAADIKPTQAGEERSNNERRVGSFLDRALAPLLRRLHPDYASRSSAGNTAWRRSPVENPMRDQAPILAPATGGDRDSAVAGVRAGDAGGAEVVGTDEVKPKNSSAAAIAPTGVPVGAQQAPAVDASQQAPPSFRASQVEAAPAERQPDWERLTAILHAHASGRQEEQAAATSAVAAVAGSDTANPSRPVAHEVEADGPQETHLITAEQDAVTSNPPQVYLQEALRAPDVSPAPAMQKHHPDPTMDRPDSVGSTDLQPEGYMDNRAILRLLHQQDAARPTDSAIHVITPRRRPMSHRSSPNVQRTADTGEAMPDPPAPEMHIERTAASTRTKSNHDDLIQELTTVQTDIGELPVDLWSLLGETPPREEHAATLDGEEAYLNQMRHPLHHELDHTPQQATEQDLTEITDKMFAWESVRPHDVQSGKPAVSDQTWARDSAAASRGDGSMQPPPDSRRPSSADLQHSRRQAHGPETEPAAGLGYLSAHEPEPNQVVQRQTLGSPNAGSDEAPDSRPGVSSIVPPHPNATTGAEGVDLNEVARLIYADIRCRLIREAERLGQ